MTAALLAAVLAVASPAPVDGLATHYPAASGHFAAGPAIRAALGPNWRGQTVRVCGLSTCITGRLLDWCACGDRHGTPTLLDLPQIDFATLAPLSRGVIAVSVTFGAAPAITPPPTDALALGRPDGAMVPV